MTGIGTIQQMNAALIDLNGPWEFRFEENRSFAEADDPDFAATDTVAVPGCYDMLPKWLCRRGTGLYRRTFTLGGPVKNAWIVVDGMGLTGRFRLDGRDLGVHPYPYARLETRKRGELSGRAVPTRTVSESPRRRPS